MVKKKDMILNHVPLVSNLLYNMCLHNSFPRCSSSYLTQILCTNSTTYNKPDRNYLKVTVLVFTAQIKIKHLSYRFFCMMLQLPTAIYLSSSGCILQTYLLSKVTQPSPPMSLVLACSASGFGFFSLRICHMMEIMCYKSTCYIIL